MGAPALPRPPPRPSPDPYHVFPPHPPPPRSPSAWAAPSSKHGSTSPLRKLLTRSRAPPGTSFAATPRTSTLPGRQRPAVVPAAENVSTRTPAETRAQLLLLLLLLVVVVVVSIADLPPAEARAVPHPPVRQPHPPPRLSRRASTRSSPTSSATCISPPPRPSAIFTMVIKTTKIIRHPSTPSCCTFLAWPSRISGGRERPCRRWRLR